MVKEQISLAYNLESITDSRMAQIVLCDKFQIYKKVSVVQQPINLTAHFTTQTGFYIVTTPYNEEVQKYCEEFNNRVNMDNIITISIIKREIWGKTGWQIIRRQRSKLPWDLRPLNSVELSPSIDTTEMTIDYFNYSSANNSRLNTEQVLYFPRLPIEAHLNGQSAIEPIEEAVNTRRLLIDDLKQASKRLWAPVGIFYIDTSNLKKPADKTARLTAFKNEIKPGRSIVVNNKVEGKIFDMKPDLNGLVRALQAIDEEIIGNWSVPKSLLAREKTVTKATLGESMRALWQGPVAALQRYFKNELERQLYNPIAVALGHPDIKVTAHWNPMAGIYDPELIKALATAAEKGLITPQQFNRMLGWPVDERTNGNDTKSIPKKDDKKIEEEE